MYKKIIRTLIVIGVIGFVAYKAYEYFVKKDQEQVDEDFIDDEELELNTEESLVDKIKAAAQRIFG